MGHISPATPHPLSQHAGDESHEGNEGNEGHEGDEKGNEAQGNEEGCGGGTHEGHEGNEKGNEGDESHEGHEGDEEGHEGDESHEGHEGDEEVKCDGEKCDLSLLLVGDGHEQCLVASSRGGVPRRALLYKYWQP